jgi:mRNA-degrading endonuclease RelE of RelBE toxin-antitoxin system
MQLEFAKGFQKDVKTLPKDVQARLKTFIQELVDAQSLEELSSVKRMKTDSKDDRLCCRVRIGDYV